MGRYKDRLKLLIQVGIIDGKHGMGQKSVGVWWNRHFGNKSVREACKEVEKPDFRSRTHPKC